MKAFNRFKSDFTLIESDQCSRRPQTPRNVAVVEKVVNMIMMYRILTVHEIAEQIEISTGFLHETLLDHAQNGCEIRYRSFAGGTEILCLTMHMTY
ncbi:hypothetical protein TNCV_1762601 [Trichonephila clavipes]|nr:hypothetical protein TNCV_1762601 [Trichonephila clavipes]